MGPVAFPPRRGPVNSHSTLNPQPSTRNLSMRLLTSRNGLLVAVVAAASSCTPIRPPRIASPLASPRMSPDSVVLDIFFVRFPLGDEEANGPLWDEIDEQHFPTELRRELAR